MMIINRVAINPWGICGCGRPVVDRSGFVTSAIATVNRRSTGSSAPRHISSIKNSRKKTEVTGDVINTGIKFPLRFPGVSINPAKIHSPVSPRLYLYRSYSTYGNPGKNNGVLSTVWNIVPAPVKAFTLIAGAAAGFFFISIPLIIICGPPLALGFWLYTRRMRRIANELYHQRWNNLGSYHLTFKDMIDETTKNSGKVDDLFSMLMNNTGGKTGDAERIARDRILDAVEHNEQNLADQLSIHNSTDIDTLTLTGLEGIQQDFRASSQGLQEKMEIRSLRLINKSQGSDRRIANITLVIQSEGSNKDKKMRIEVEVLDSYGTASSRIVLDGSSPGHSKNPEDTIIEVDPAHYRRTK